MRFSSFNDPFRIYTLKEVLQRVSIPVNVDENKLYYQIGIRSHSKGIFYKEAETGKQIGNKRIFWIEQDCLILNIVFAWEQAVSKTSEKEVGMVASHRFPMYKVLNNSLDYIVDFFKTEKGKQLLQMASPSGAGRNKTLNQDFFLNSKIYLPSLNEQSKTSKLIKLIEDRIETQSKIINDLKAQKNYIIHSIFSKLNSKLVLITDIAEIYQPQTISSANFDESAEFPVFGANGIIGYYEKYNHENEQICIACRGASVGTINLSKKKSWITGNSMVINSDNYDDIIDKKFLYYQLMFIDFNKYISGSGQPQITRESLKNLKIKVPSLEAQQLISNILNHIDLKITIELKLLCQYQLQKAFLLKNMFV